MKRKSFLFVTVLVLIAALTACSSAGNDEASKESVFSKEPSSPYGDWMFELQAEDEVWKFEVSLREDGTCDLFFAEAEDSIERLKYNGKYTLVQNPLELPDDMISNIVEDADSITNCTFAYNAETDRLATTFDAGAYVAFIRADKTGEQERKSNMGMFESSDKLYTYLTGAFEKEWSTVKTSKGKSVAGKWEVEARLNPHNSAVTKFKMIVRDDNTGVVMISHSMDDLEVISNIADVEYKIYQTIDDYYVEGDGLYYDILGKSVVPLIYHPETKELCTLEMYFESGSEEGIEYYYPLLQPES